MENLFPGYTLFPMCIKYKMITHLSAEHNEFSALQEYSYLLESTPDMLKTIMNYVSLWFNAWTKNCIDIKASNQVFITYKATRNEITHRYFTLILIWNTYGSVTEDMINKHLKRNSKGWQMNETFRFAIRYQMTERTEEKLIKYQLMVIFTPKIWSDVSVHFHTAW